MDCAVVDAGGNLEFLIKMDGSWLRSIGITIKKAKTAHFFDMPNGEIEKLYQNRDSYFLKLNIRTVDWKVSARYSKHELGSSNYGRIGLLECAVADDPTVAEAGI